MIRWYGLSISHPIILNNFLISFRIVWLTKHLFNAVKI